MSPHQGASRVLSPKSRRDEILKEHARRLRILGFCFLAIAFAYSFVSAWKHLPQVYFAVFAPLLAVVATIVSLEIPADAVAKLQNEPSVPMGDWEKKSMRRAISSRYFRMGIIALGTLLATTRLYDIPLPRAIVVPAEAFVGLFMEVYQWRAIQRLKNRLG